MTSRSLALAALALLLAGTGCVSKKAHEAMQQDLQAQLTECQADKKASQDLAAGMQKKLSQDDDRWRNLEQTMTTTIPEMQAEFEEQRKSILTLVPREIRSQVAERLDKHFASVNTQLSGMRDTMTSMESDLGAAREEITALRGQTQGVADKVDATNATLTGENADLKKQLAGQRKRAAELVAKVTEFDAAHLNCEDCEERLKMKERSREALRALHGSLVSGLSELQGSKAP